MTFFCFFCALKSYINDISNNNTHISIANRLNVRCRQSLSGEDDGSEV